MKALLVVPFAALALAACGGDGEGPVSPGDAAGLSGTVTVQGGIIAVRGQPVLLCSALLESYPPQCGRPALVVRGLDLDTVEGLTRAQGVAWTDRSVRLTGTLVDGVLDVTAAP